MIKRQFTVGLAAVLFAALFIFSNTNGDITVWGDDAWFRTNATAFSWNYFTHSNRGYTLPFHRMIFNLFGQNSQKTHLFYFFLFVLSAVLFYTVFAKLAGYAPAAIGAIFYLGYIAKYEIVTWMAAGGYLVCLNVLFLSVWIALSERFGAWTKGWLIAGINWLCVLLYEILIVAAPLYPLLYWLHQRLRRKRVDRRALAAACLPLAVFAGHILVMYFGTAHDAPLPWQRASTRSGMELETAVARIEPTFKNAIFASVGRAHFDLLTSELDKFWNHYPITTGMKVEAVGVCVAIALLLWLGPVIAFDKSIFVPLAAAAVYLAVLSPMIGLTTSPIEFAPSRLLSLTCVGLAMLATALVWIALNVRFRVVGYAVAAAMLSVAAVEAAAMNAILYEYQTAWAYDSHILAQLLESGIKPQRYDTIFISLPEHPMKGFWRVGFSQFDGGHIGMVLASDFGVLAEHIPLPALRYVDATRHAGTPVAPPAPEPGHQMFCFSVSDGDYHLTRIDCGR